MSNKINVLFIGGGMDGEFMRLMEGGDTYQYAEKIAVPVAESLAEFADNKKHVTYYHEILRGKDKDFHIYRHESLSVNDCLERLTLFYRPGAHKGEKI